MPLNQLKETSRRWNCFSGVDLLGAFDFYTYTVSLDSLTIDLGDAKRFGDALAGLALGKRLDFATYEWLQKRWPLAVHEYTHFVDASSSLWGMRHLRGIADAYGAGLNVRGGFEANFFKAKELYDRVRCIRLPNYYTEQAKGAGNERPWSARITAGKLFASDGRLSDRTVVFARFSNRRDELLVRSPVSTVSILEASAFAQELQVRFIATSMLPEDVRLVELARQREALLDYIYDPRFTEYSVCAHIVANRLGCTDLVAAYMLCCLLARVVLNFTDQAYLLAGDHLDDVFRKLRWSGSLLDPVRAGIHQKDMGTLFYLLAMLLPDGSHSDPTSMVDGVSEALRAFGLDLERLAQGARSEVTDIANEIAGCPIGSLRELASAGLANHLKLSYRSFDIPFEQLALPPAVLGDLSTVALFSGPNNLLSDFNVEHCYDELVQGQLWVERFSESCV